MSCFQVLPSLDREPSRSKSNEASQVSDGLVPLLVCRLLTLHSHQHAAPDKLS